MTKLIYTSLNFNKLSLLDIDTLNKYDTLGMYKVYDSWPRIAKKSYESNLDKYDFNDIDTFVFAGMGGSGALGDIFSSVLSKTKNHVYVIKGYLLPKALTEKSLIVTTSVSGNTKETLTVLESAKKITKNIIAFSSNGVMKNYCKENNIEHRNIQEEHSPRASFVKFLYSMLNVLGHSLSIKKEDIIESLNTLETTASQINSRNLHSNNLSLHLAEWIPNISMIYYPYGLLAAATRFKNSLQENAKLHVMIEDVVEASHNSVVSWEKNSEVKPILLEGRDDYIKTKERWCVLKKYFKENNIDFREIYSIEGSILAKLINMIYILDYATIYRAVLSETDPSPVNSIDYIKNNLT